MSYSGVLSLLLLVTGFGAVSEAGAQQSTEPFDLLIAGDQTLVGKTVEEAAQERNITPVQMALELQLKGTGAGPEARAYGVSRSPSSMWRAARSG